MPRGQPGKPVETHVRYRAGRIVEQSVRTLARGEPFRCAASEIALRPSSARQIQRGPAGRLDPAWLSRVIAPAAVRIPGAAEDVREIAGLAKNHSILPHT